MAISVSAKKTLLVIIVAAIVLPIAGVLLVPAPEHTVSITAGQFPGSMATAILESVFYVGAAILFVTGLRSFKERLQRLYGAICAALVLTSIVSLQVPFLIAYDIFNGPWVRAGGIGLPNTIAAIIFYTSLYLFAKIIGKQNRLLSPLVVWLTAVAVALISALAQTAITPFGFAAEVAGTVFAWAGALLALLVRKHIGAAYTKAMKWLAISCAVLGAAYAVGSGYDFFFRAADPGLGFLYTMASIMFVVAGYSFRKISDQQVSKERREMPLPLLKLLPMLPA
ncbi:MAG TPA: hypothetical protein VFZ58_04840 [Candidatus Saccharimonadales bacterium]